MNTVSKNELREVLGEEGFALFVMADPFKPCGSYDVAMDRFTYLEEDVSYRTKYSATSNVILLVHPHEERIIGVQIQHFSEYARLQLAEACSAEMPRVVRWQIRLYARYLHTKTVWRFKWRELKQRFKKS